MHPELARYELKVSGARISHEAREPALISKFEEMQSFHFQRNFLDRMRIIGLYRGLQFYEVRSIFNGALGAV